MRHCIALILVVVCASAWELRPRRLPTSLSRRDCFQIAFGMGCLTTGLVPRQAWARDEIFRPNPLTNPVLERVRILDQAAADELKYGGELEAGDAGKNGANAYPTLLVPILSISNDLNDIDRLVSSQSSSVNAWSEARMILSKSEYQTKNFKKIFNRFGDNIYYSDPDRANLYLGGGATPKSEQSLAYLLRNEILTKVEDMIAELDYLIKTPDESPEDLQAMSRTACDAMKRYLAVVPPSELEQAKLLMSQASD